MRVAINLLQESQKIKARLRRMGLALQTASVAVLIAFGVLVFLLFSYTLFLDSKNKNLSQAIEKQVAAVEELRVVETKQVLVRQKLKLASQVIFEPSLPYDVATDLFDLASSRMKVGGVSSAKGDEIIHLTKVEASEVFSLNNFLDELVEFAKQHNAKLLMADSLSRGGEGSYSFQISITYEGE